MIQYNPQETNQAIRELKAKCNYEPTTPGPLFKAPKWLIKTSLSFLAVGFLIIGLASTNPATLAGLFVGGVFGVIAIFV